jgi:hypothetical protein
LARQDIVLTNQGILAYEAKNYWLCPTFYTHCSPLILGPLSTNSAMSKERYFIA